MMRRNARSRSFWKDLERVANIYDEDGCVILDVGIHGDVYPGGHKYMFENAEYETLDIDADVMPTHVGDIRNLDFPSEIYDLVLCVAVIEHVMDKRAFAYDELYRITKVGGTIVYVWPKLLDEREAEPAKQVSLTHIRNCHRHRDYDLKLFDDGMYYMEVRKI